MPRALGATGQVVGSGEINAFQVILVFAIAIFVTWGVVFVERAQRRIPIHHARRQQGRTLVAAQPPHLQLKLNTIGRAHA